MTSVARKCSEKDCPGTYKARGLCSKHYRRALKTGNPPTNYIPRIRRTCSAPGCELIHYSKGYCNPHYQRHLSGRPIEGEFRLTDPGRGCKVPRCDRPHGQNGYCQAHNKRYQAGGDMSRPIQTRGVRFGCFVSGCDEKHLSRGVCSLHYSVTRSFNLSLIQYMMIQEAGCQICGALEKLHIDHDHKCCPKNGESCGECLRGGLCPTCNVGIGMLGDSIPNLQSAIRYLTAYSVV